MTDDELEVALHRIGKAAFVEHFDLFQGYAVGRFSKLDCERELAARKPPRGAAWRLHYAKAIFENGRECDSLRVISSSRVPDNVRTEAQRLLTVLCR